MKKIFISSIVALFLLSSIQLLADGKGETPPANASNLTGQILDLETGEALVGVAVSIEGTDLKAYTDFDGNFQIKGMKPGKYNLIATYISYKKSLVENIDLEAGDEEDIDIQLQASK